jgi:hypothetical protein
MMIAKRGSAEDEEKAPNLSSAAEDVNQGGHNDRRRKQVVMKIIKPENKV